MSTDRSPNYLRGFILPFQQFTNNNLWAAQSTLTQGTGRAGIPSSTKTTSLSLTAKGTQDKDVDIKTERAGHISDHAGFVWKETTETDYLGADVPTMVSDISVAVSNGGSALLQYISRDAIRLASGKIINVSEKITATLNSIAITIIDIDGSSSSSTIHNADVSTLGGQKRFPCICLMPDESLLVAYWITNNLEDTANIEVQRSTDDGSNWSKVSSRAIPEDISTANTFGSGNAGYDLDRLTMASNSSQVLLFAGLLVHDTGKANGNVIYQYASTSEGMKFNLIAQTSETTGGLFYYPDIVQYNDSFIISWISSQDSIAFTRLSNAFENINTKLGTTAANTLSTDFTVTTVVTTGAQTRNTDGNKSMWHDSDGRIYLAYVESGTHRRMHGAFSDLQGVAFPDYGKEWTEWGEKGGSKTPRMLHFNPPAATGAGGVTNISGVSGTGSQQIFCQFDPAGTNNYKDSIFLLSMGGYTTVNYPALVEYPLDQNRGYSTLDWLPIDKPEQASVWTKNTSGAPADTLTTKLALACASAETISYSRSISDKTAGIVIHCQTSNITGGSVTRGNGIQVQIQEQGSTDTIKVEVIIGATSIYVYDVHAGYGSALASATGLSLTTTDILMYVDNAGNKVEVYYAEGQNPRKYSKLSGNLTTNANTTQNIEWGQISSSGTSRSADWHLFSYSTGDTAGLGITDQLIAKNYSPQGFYTPIDAGLKISTIDGPAREGDEYSIVSRFDTPADRMLYSIASSREVTWKSTAITTDPDTNSPAQEKIAWVLDSNLLGTDSKPVSDSLGIHLANINFREVTIEKYSSSSWSTIGTFSNAFDYQSFNFSRVGNSIVNTDGTGAFLNLNEAQGWRILLDNGSGTTLVRKIATNSEGVLAATSSKKAVLQLEDAKSGDPTSAPAYLIPTSLTILLHNIGSIAALRITIPSQRTREGYFQIGTMVMGPLFVPAGQYSRGRTINFEADISETEGTNGILRSARTGAGGRTVRIAWTEGVDISALYEASADPDYWKASTAGAAVAAVGSAPMSILGLLQYIGGSVEALVYLPSISHGAATTQILNGYHDHVLCTMGSDVQIEHIVGDENRPTGEGEVFRVGTMVLRETR